MFRVAIPIWLMYLALSENLQWNNLVVGAAIALGVAALMRPGRHPFDARRFPARLLAGLHYLLVLAADIVLNGLQVARIVLSPALPIRPGVIAIPGQAQSEVGAALCAHSITITPGELVIEIGDDGTMYVHCLDATRSGEYVAGAQRLRQRLLRRIVE